MAPATLSWSSGSLGLLDKYGTLAQPDKLAARFSGSAHFWNLFSEQKNRMCLEGNDAINLSRTDRTTIECWIKSVWAGMIIFSGVCEVSPFLWCHCSAYTTLAQRNHYSNKVPVCSDTFDSCSKYSRQWIEQPHCIYTHNGSISFSLVGPRN